MIHGEIETIHQLSPQKKLISDDSKKLLGARFGRLLEECDNCKKTLVSLCVVIMKPTPPKQFHGIYILCKPCRLIHSSVVRYYLHLNK